MQETEVLSSDLLLRLLAAGFRERCDDPPEVDQSCSGESGDVLRSMNLKDFGDAHLEWYFEHKDLECEWERGLAAQTPFADTFMRALVETRPSAAAAARFPEGRTFPDKFVPLRQQGTDRRTSTSSSTSNEMRMDRTLLSLAQHFIARMPRSASPRRANRRTAIKVDNNLDEKLQQVEKLKTAPPLFLAYLAANLGLAAFPQDEAKTILDTFLEYVLAQAWGARDCKYNGALIPLGRLSNRRESAASFHADPPAVSLTALLAALSKNPSLKDRGSLVQQRHFELLARALAELDTRAARGEQHQSNISGIIISGAPSKPTFKEEEEKSDRKEIRRVVLTAEDRADHMVQLACESLGDFGNGDDRDVAGVCLRFTAPPPAETKSSDDRKPALPPQNKQANQVEAGAPQEAEPPDTNPVEVDGGFLCHDDTSNQYGGAKASTVAVPVCAGSSLEAEFDGVAATANPYWYPNADGYLEEVRDTLPTHLRRVDETAEEDPLPTLVDSDRQTIRELFRVLFVFRCWAESECHDPEVWQTLAEETKKCFDDIKTSWPFGAGYREATLQWVVPEDRRRADPRFISTSSDRGGPTRRKRTRDVPCSVCSWKGADVKNYIRNIPWYGPNSGELLCQECFIEGELDPLGFDFACDGLGPHRETGPHLMLVQPGFGFKADGTRGADFFDSGGSRRKRNWVIARGFPDRLPDPWLLELAERMSGREHVD